MPGFGILKQSEENYVDCTWLRVAQVVKVFLLTRSDVLGNCGIEMLRKRRTAFVSLSLSLSLYCAEDHTVRFLFFSICMYLYARACGEKMSKQLLLFISLQSSLRSADIT